jgi:hypothetical protein
MFTAPTVKIREDVIITGERGPETRSSRAPIYRRVCNHLGPGVRRTQCKLPRSDKRLAEHFSERLETQLIPCVHKERAAFSRRSAAGRDRPGCGWVERGSAGLGSARQGSPSIAFEWWAAFLGRAGRGWAWQGAVGRGAAWLGWVRPGEASQGSPSVRQERAAFPGKARRGALGRGAARSGWAEDRWWKSP